MKLVKIRWTEKHEEEVLISDSELDDIYDKANVDTSNPTYKSCWFEEFEVIREEGRDPMDAAKEVL